MVTTRSAATGAASGQRDGPPRDRWLLVIGTGLVVFMATLDASVVTVAMPVLQKDFGIDAGLGQWVILGYLLPLIAVTLPAGRWIDRVGRRVALVTMVTGFAVASVLVGLAPTIGTLIAARAVQGTFAGVLFALLPVVVTEAVRPAARGRAMALSTTLGPLGSVSGPAVGGLLIDSWGWPWVFWINVPIAVAVLVIAWRQLPAGGPLRGPAPGSLAEIGLLGAATTAVLLALTFTATTGPGWLLLGLLAVPTGYLWWRRRDSAPVLAAHRVRPVRIAQAALFGSSVATAGALFLLPYFLQTELHRSAATTGLVVLALPVATAVLGPVGGVLADRWNPTMTSICGAALLTVGLGLLVPIGPGWTPADLVWRLAVAGAGMGLFYGPNMATMFGAAPPSRLGIIGAASSLVRQLGFAVGPAITTLAWAIGDYSVHGFRIGLALTAVAAGGVLWATIAMSRGDPIGTGPARPARARRSAGAAQPPPPSRPGAPEQPIRIPTDTRRYRPIIPTQRRIP